MAERFLLCSLPEEGTEARVSGAKSSGRISRLEETVEISQRHWETISHTQKDVFFPPSPPPLKKMNPLRTERPEQFEAAA